MSPVLWVDDEPGKNRDECRMFTALGATVSQVETTREAIAALTGGKWDVLLSDVARDDVPDAGLTMLGQLPPGSPPVVFYVGRVDPARPVPVGAFGVEDQPDPLLHLVLDVLERRRS